MEYVHGYSANETTRLTDQATSLTELLHADTVYPAGSRVLEADMASWAAGIRDLYRTAEDEGTFCYTFLEAAGPRGDTSADDGAG